MDFTKLLELTFFISFPAYAFFRLVDSIVFGKAYNLEIFYAIVGSVVIFMMNVFARLKVPSKKSFHHNAMLAARRFPTGETNLDVSVFSFVNTCFFRDTLSGTTKFSGGRCVQEFFAALIANPLVSFVPANVVSWCAIFKNMFIDGFSPPCSIREQLISNFFSMIKSHWRISPIYGF